MYLPYSIGAEELARMFKKLPSRLKLAGLKLLWPAHLSSLKRYKTPALFTFYVTNKCNSNCIHCYYNRSLNSGGEEMDLEQIKKTFASLKNRISNILVTGGEPFLREDIAQICIFLGQGRARVIDVATNGLETSRIFQSAEEILGQVSGAELHLGISLDGLQPTHDRIRGVPGAYGRTLETIKRLKSLQSRHKNFFLAAVTTICDQNYQEIPRLVRLVKDELQLRHSLAFIRSTREDCFNNELGTIDFSPRDPDCKKPSLKELEELSSLIQGSLGVGPLLGRIESLRREHSLNILKDKKPLFPCISGQISATIYPDASVAICNFTRPAANLKEYGFDFFKLWNSPEMLKQRQANRDCACTWPRNLITSMCYDFNSAVKLIAD